MISCFVRRDGALSQRDGDKGTLPEWDLVELQGTINLNDKGGQHVSLEDVCKNDRKIKAAAAKPGIVDFSDEMKEQSCFSNSEIGELSFNSKVQLLLFICKLAY